MKVQMSHHYQSTNSTQMQQLPSLNIEAKETASEGEKGVNKEDNINHMEECNDITTDNECECNVISGGESQWMKKQNVFIRHR